MLKSGFCFYQISIYKEKIFPCYYRVSFSHFTKKSFISPLMHNALKYSSIVHMIEMCGASNRIEVAPYDTINHVKSGVFEMIFWTFRVTHITYVLKTLGNTDEILVIIRIHSDETIYSIKMSTSITNIIDVDTLNIIHVCMYSCTYEEQIFEFLAP